MVFCRSEDRQCRRIEINADRAGSSARTEECFNKCLEWLAGTMESSSSGVIVSGTDIGGRSSKLEGGCQLGGIYCAGLCTWLDRAARHHTCVHANGWPAPGRAFPDQGHCRMAKSHLYRRIARSCNHEFRPSFLRVRQFTSCRSAYAKSLERISTFPGCHLGGSLSLRSRLSGIGCIAFRDVISTLWNGDFDTGAFHTCSCRGERGQRACHSPC